MRETGAAGQDNYKPGGHYGVCDVCGLVYRMYEMSERWDGAIACKECWEPQHPQEFVEGRVDKITVRNARPDDSSNEITVPITPDDL